MGGRRPSSGGNDLVLWVEGRQGLVLASEVIPSETSAEGALESFRQALQSPLVGTPGLPARVDVECESLLDALAPLASALGIEVRVRSGLARLGEAYTAFEDFVDVFGFSYLDYEGVTPSQIAGLAAAAVGFYELEPWARIPQHEALEIRGLCEEPVFAMVLGHSGIERGLTVFLTREGAQACVDRVSPEVWTKTPGLLVTYEQPDEIGLATVDDIEEHEWPVTSAGEFVRLLRFDRPGDPVPEPDEIRLASEVLGVVSRAVRLIDEHGVDSLEFTAQLKGRELQVLWPALAPSTAFRLDLPTRGRGVARRGEGRKSQAV